MTILLHILYLSLLPLAFELGTEVYRTKVLGRRDKHFLTACIRYVLMAWGSLTYDAVPWWITFQVIWTVHTMFFNYSFNRYALGAHWSYLGNNLLDRLQKRVNPWLLLAGRFVWLAEAVIVLLFKIDLI